tara:strand:- start:387 stop:581 length:195 start_codon:yes stop_codon:yes gene_type:complete
MTTHLKTAKLDSMQKEVLRQAIFMYVSELQGKFYRDKSIDGQQYETDMKTISEIVDVLHLKNCY